MTLRHPVEHRPDKDQQNKQNICTSESIAPLLRVSYELLVLAEFKNPQDFLSETMSDFWQYI